MGNISGGQSLLHARSAAVSPRPALSLFVFFLLFYYFTNAGWYKAGDEHFMCETARQMAHNGRIGFTTEDPLRAGYFSRGADGLSYSKWGLGQPVVETPFYFIHSLITRTLFDPRNGEGSRQEGVLLEMALVFLCPSMISALGCVLMLWLGLRLGFSTRVSMVLALLYGLATMVWPYSKSLMSEATLNVAVLGGVYGAVSYVSGRRGPWLALSGACMGFALITKAISLVIVPVIVLYVALRVPSRRGVRDLVLWFVLPWLAFLLVQFWHNQVRFGDIWQFGYNTGQDVLGFSTPLYIGLWGLFASPGKSFFLYTPTALLGLACIRRFHQRRAPESLLFLGVVAVFTLPHAVYYGWSGDWAWGPRFLLIITPYVILPAGVLFEGWSDRVPLKRNLTIALVTVSLAVQVIGVTIHPFTFIRLRGEVINRIIQVSPRNYAALYCGDEIASFVPRFSHILGNWWLFKHMIFSYDLGSDVPWKGMEKFNPSIETPWIRGNRPVPFWWPVSFPMTSPPAGAWVYPLAVVNLIMVIFWGARIGRLLRRGNSGRGQDPVPEEGGP